MRAIWGAAAATALTLAAVLMAAAPGRVHSAASAIVQAALELRSRLV